MKYAVAVGSESLATLLFGARLEGLDAVPGERIGGVLHEFASVQSRAALGQIDALVTGWSTPRLSAADLEAAPQLRAVVHAGGSALPFLPPGAGERLTLAVSADVNARPVAEFTLAMILLANKDAFRARRLYRKERIFIDRDTHFADAGNRGRVVGLLSASRIGRRVAELLRPFDVELLIADPFLTADGARALGARLVPLEELFGESDVLSIHTPVLPETIGLVDGTLLGLLRDGATLINTARGAVVDQDALIAELVSGRIDAILDVTEPDVLPATSPLYDLPNVFLTPHIAGSMGTEIRRIGEHVADELTRFARDQPFAEPEPPARGKGAVHAPSQNEQRSLHAG